jgi:hypothetical protein
MGADYRRIDHKSTGGRLAHVPGEARQVSPAQLGCVQNGHKSKTFRAGNTHRGSQ